MKITKELILSWAPCDDWTEDMIAGLIKKHCGRRKIIKFSDIVSAYHNKDLDAFDFMWLVFRPEIIPEDKLHKIAIFCWGKIARPIWEKYHPNDRRPHEAIRVKRLWLNGKASDEELSMARAAAWDASRTAAWYAARAASRAAARYAALAASRAAARYAALDADRAAAWAAAWDAVNKKIVIYAIRIMK